MQVKSIRDAEVSDKRVLLRAGLNVPMGEDGRVADVFRLKSALPTIEFLAGRGAKVVILAHLGRKGETLRPVAEALSSLTKVPVTFTDVPHEGAGIAVADLAEGSCVVLENVRQNPGEEKNDERFAQTLASLGDLFVNDAFADSHREHASVVGIAKFLPSYLGLLMEREVTELTKALTPPEGSLAIIGGAKFETKEPLIKKLLPLYGRICVGGALANDFLKARGLELGTSLVSKKPVPPELAMDPRIVVEHDVLAVRAGFYRRIAGYEDIRQTERVVDAGPQTAAAWSDYIMRSPFVLWNGPIGVYEEGYTTGTDALARALAQSSTRAAVGGGDTVAALEKFTFDEERVFLSSGGGAMLQFLAEGTLPGIKAVQESAA